MSNRKIKGILIIIWSVFFVHFETRLFGYNLFPESLEELICDFIGAGMCLIGIYYLITKRDL